MTLNKLTEIDLGLTSYLTSAFAVTFLYLLIAQFKKSRRPAPLPPGPPADPILGHLRLIPSQGQPELFHEWAKIYGDVIHLKCLGRNLIVLDSIEAARDLLDKRGAIYSCRPDFPIYKLMGIDRSLPLLPYGTQFQKHRKLFQTYYGSHEIMEYIPLQTDHARLLARNLVSDPDKHESYLTRYVTAVITEITTAHKITSDDDTILHLVEESSAKLNDSGSPGNTPIDFFPWLRHLPSWFPGSYYAWRAHSVQGLIQEIYEYPVKIIEEQLANGTSQPCLIADQLQMLSAPETPSLSQSSEKSAKDNKIELIDIMGASFTSYSAGTDTTQTTLSVFLLAMIFNPECQQKAQQEIDLVIGKDRLPEYADCSSLPYVESVLQEVLRWYPIVPLGVPHRVTEDDIYKGMFIPKGSLVIGNARGMSLNENVYTNPTKFNPSRFLPKPDGLGEPHFIHPWGFGRRICPGRFLAENSLWIAIATLLATVNIVKAKGKDGKDITPEYAFSTGVVSQPLPFRCGIVFRGSQYEKMIQDSTL